MTLDTHTKKLFPIAAIKCGTGGLGVVHWETVRG